jgi:hypothetical protein
MASSCVLTEQIRYKRILTKTPPASIPTTVLVDEEGPDEIIWEWEDDDIRQPISRNIHQSLLKGSYVWYHPNDWWRIETLQFPVSPDSMEYRMFRPQYGLGPFIDTNGQVLVGRWDEWQVANHFFNEPAYGGHMWAGFIRANHSIFTQHPEYLAEVKGVRLGHGKTNKLCVSNLKLQQLFADYVEDIVRKNPSRPAVSVEPSDGGNFCSCKGCQKIGSESNQAFLLANVAAKRLKSKGYSTRVYIYAYNLHSELPDFPLEDNITVQVIPRGFQRIYQPEVMMQQWADFHGDLFYRDYFGIPQWTADLPRVDVPAILQRTKRAFDQSYRAVVMETGANLNAAILFVLFNAIWMNPELSYEQVLDKFIADCFPQSAIPMKRLFYRWHHSWLKDAELPAALFDLRQARSLASDPQEIRRLKDVLIYIHMIDAYLTWTQDIQSKVLTDQYFESMYRSAAHNVINSRAIATMYDKYLTPFPDLRQKYQREAQPKPWAKSYSDLEADVLFRNMINKYGAVQNDFLYRTPFEVPMSAFQSGDFHPSISIGFANNSECHLVCKEEVLLLEARYTPNDASPLLVSVFDQNMVFLHRQFLSNGQKAEIKLPTPGVYGISYHRANAGTLTFSGGIIPVLTEARAKARHTYYNLDKAGQWLPVQRGQNLPEISEFYFQLNRN